MQSWESGSGPGRAGSQEHRTKAAAHESLLPWQPRGSLLLPQPVSPGDSCQEGPTLALAALLHNGDVSRCSPVAFATVITACRFTLARHSWEVRKLHAEQHE